VSGLFRKIGNFLFHTRNVLFPITIVVLLFLWPPVAIGHTGSDLLLFSGLLFILIGQAIRVLTISLEYIKRGGKNRQIFAEKLVTGGIFSHSRNPMYAGNTFLGTGVLSVAGNVTGLIVGSILILTTYRLIVHSEECFLREKFAEIYDAYCASVPRWLPNIRSLKETIHDYEYKFDWSRVALKEHTTLFMYLMLPLVLIAWKLHLANLLEDYQFVFLSLAVLFISAFSGVRFLKKSGRLIAMRKKARNKNTTQQKDKTA